jgi:hypothetical protein
MYNNKYLKYKKKYLSLKTQIAGGEKTRNIADLQQTITDQEFRNDIDENRLYYNSTCLHSKLSDLEIARNLHKKSQADIAERERVQKRMEEISKNPNVILSEQEYQQLTPEQKQLGWVHEFSGPSYNQYKVWRRQTLQDKQAQLELTVDWRIQNDPNVILSEQEYQQLTPEQKQGWVHQWSGPSYAAYKVWKRKTQQDINNEHNIEVRKLMETILNKGRQYYLTDYNMRLPDFAIRNDRDTYIQLQKSDYDYYKIIESQLRK